MSNNTVVGRRRRALPGLVLLCLTLLLGCPSPGMGPGRDAHHRAATEIGLQLPDSTTPEIRASDLEDHVRALTDERTRGRATGEAGERIAADYLARMMASLGLEPAGSEAGYFHRFDFTAGVSLGEGNRLSLETDGSRNGAATGVDRDWRPLAFSRSGEIEASQIICAGYGLVAPGHDGEPPIDSYADLDVEGRWVLVFRDLPTDLDDSQRQFLQRHASLRYKAMIARDRGARGVLFVAGPLGGFRNELVPLRFDASLAGTRIAVLSISDALAGEILAPTGKTLEAIQRDFDLANPHSAPFEIPSTRLAAHVELLTEHAEGRNVLGRLQVGTLPSDQLVVLGAHFDHLGTGHASSSLASGDEIGQIHPGADDNASGVALLLEIAEALVHAKRRGAAIGQRDIVFAAWSGEELGLLGSDRWVSDVVSSHSREAGPVAYLNFDMVGRLADALVVQGLGSSPAWEGLLEEARQNTPGLAIQTQQDSYLPTDATSFYTKKIPILSAFTGAHADYHKPSDRLELLNLEGTAQIGRLFVDMVRLLSEATEAPTYRAQRMPAPGLGRSGFRVFLGTVPDYAQTDVVGVRLSGVAPQGPAEAAGVRGGDLIIEVGGKTIENLYDYTFALQGLRAGRPARIVILRDGERLEFEVLPSSRD